MAKVPKNQGKEWNKADINKLKTLKKGNTPTGLISHELGRSVGSVRSKASELNISLKPTNKTPYNRLKK